METRLKREAPEWHISYWPLVLSVGVLLLLPISFILYFDYGKGLPALISLAIGLPLTLLGIWGWTTEGLEDREGYGEGLSLWGMPVFIVAEAMLFVSLFAAYWVLRLGAPFWPPIGTPEEMPVLVPIIMTIILVASSVTIHIGEKRLERGGTSEFLPWLVGTIALGTLFLAFTAYEWTKLYSEGFTLKTNIYSTAFYSITGFHASHVLVGIGIFLVILFPALKGRVNETFIKSASMYWHFVDVVWFFVVSQLYFW